MARALAPDRVRRFLLIGRRAPFRDKIPGCGKGPEFTMLGFFGKLFSLYLDGVVRILPQAFFRILWARRTTEESDALSVAGSE
jgi:hypothetical protein